MFQYALVRSQLFFPSIAIVISLLLLLLLACFLSRIHFGILGNWRKANCSYKLDGIKVSSALSLLMLQLPYKLPFRRCRSRSSALSIIINLEIIHELISISFYWQFFVFSLLSSLWLSKIPLLLALHPFTAFLAVCVFVSSLQPLASFLPSCCGVFFCELFSNILYLCLISPSAAAVLLSWGLFPAVVQTSLFTLCKNKTFFYETKIY
jgi:hypothetical protein